MKKISNIFIVLAVVLSDVMCAVVGYHYAAMQWGIQYAGYSAPAGTVCDSLCAKHCCVCDLGNQISQEVGQFQFPQ